MKRTVSITLLLSVVLFSALQLQAQNLVVNGEFDDGLNGWGGWIDEAGTQVEVVLDTDGALSGANSMRLDVVEGSADVWRVQRNQRIDIIEGHVYEATFMGKASKDGVRIELSSQHDADPYDGHMNVKIDLTTEAQTFGPFTLNPLFTDDINNFGFFLGATDSVSIWIDAVELVDVTPIEDPDIIWVSAAIQDSNGVDSDQGFVDVLEANGYTVRRENDTMKNGTNPLTEEQRAVLESGKLIIFSRSASSGDYNNVSWNTLNKPMILLSSYLSRASRWQWLNNSDLLGDGDSGAPLFQVHDPMHPIFDGVTLDANNQVAVLDGSVGSGNSSLPGRPDFGNGELLASVVDTGTVTIVYWPWFKKFHSETAQYSGAARLLFNAGTRENTEPGNLQGMYNLTPDGEKMFLNAVAWMMSLEAPIVETGMMEDFNEPVDLDVWRPNKLVHPDSTPVFDVSQEDNALKVVMKQMNFPDGQRYDFGCGCLFNLTDNPVASMKLKLEPGAMWGTNEVTEIPFALSPWEGDSIRQHTNVEFSVPADGEWHDYFFDWREPDADLEANPNNYLKITNFLLETVKWPDPHSATFWIDDFKVGDAAVELFDITDLMGPIAGQNDHLPWTGPASDGSPGAERIAKLIDNNDSTKYLVGAEQVWIEYRISYLARPVGYSLTSANDAPTRDPNTWDFQGWDAATNSWVTLHSVTNHPEWPERYQKEEFYFTNMNWYNKFRLNITAINGDPEGLMQIAEWEIFAEMSDEYVPDDIVKIFRASSPPVLDGVMEPLWYNAGEQRDYIVIPAIDDPDPVNDWFDMGLSFRALYDATNLYVFMSVKDDDYNRDSGDSWWQDDSYELYIDGDNSKGTSYDGVNDQGFHWSYNPSTILDPDPLGWETMGVNQTDYGIDLEVAIPLENLGIVPEPGWKIGIEVQWNEDDAGGDRDEKVQFFSSADAAWSNPSTMGTAELQADAVYPELAVYQTLAAPVIDGEMDELWNRFPLITNNNYPEVSSGIANLSGGWKDASYSFRSAWDEDNLYMFIVAKDETFMDDSGDDAWYNDDSFELYLDGDNSKGSSYDGTNDWALHWMYNEATILEPDFDLGTDMKWAYTDDGIALEMAIPLDSIGVTAAVGSMFGIEVDYNDDDDGGDRDTKIKYYTTIDDSWQNPSTFGTAVLAGPTRTDVEENVDAVVSTYELKQNYPNPFNPTTTIEFNIPKADQIKLSIYDILGRRVTTLVDERMEAGVHTVSFDAGKFASGVYIYSLQTSDRVINKKMMLLK